MWGKDAIQPHFLGITKQRAATGYLITLLRRQQRYKHNTAAAAAAAAVAVAVVLQQWCTNNRTSRYGLLCDRHGAFVFVREQCSPGAANSWLQQQYLFTSNSSNQSHIVEPIPPNTYIETPDDVGSTYVQERFAQNFVHDAGLMGQGGSFGRQAFI